MSEPVFDDALTTMEVYALLEKHREAEQEAENAAIMAEGPPDEPDEHDHIDEVADVMEDSPITDQHGRKSSNRSGVDSTGFDGEAFRPR